MSRLFVLFCLAFFTAALFLFNCGPASDEEGTDRDLAEESADTDDDADSSEDDAADIEPDFVLNGGVYRSSLDDHFVEIRLADVLDNPENLELDLVENLNVTLPSLFDAIDENSFLLLEDGIPLDVTIDLADKESKEKGPGRVYVMLDWTDSMADEYGNAMTSITNLLDDLSASYNPLRVYVNLFKDYSSDWRYYDSGNWYNGNFGSYVWSQLSSINEGFGGQGTMAENPLDAIYYRWNNGGYQNNTQTIFLLVTDGPMHQPGDGDVFDWPSATGYSTAQVAASLTGASYNPKARAYVASPSRQTGHWSGTYAYWDNRRNVAPSEVAGSCPAPPDSSRPAACWTTDTYAGHDTPYNLYAQVGGAYYNLDAHGAGYFQLAKKGAGSGQKDISLVFESANAAARHDLVLTAALEDGRWGEIVFENISYIEPLDDPLE